MDTHNILGIPPSPRGTQGVPSNSKVNNTLMNSPDHSANARGKLLGKVKPKWIKVIESEQRMQWLKSMIRKKLLVRDIEAFLKTQGDKLRSGERNIREEERDILMGMMNIKLKDEKKNYRKLKKEKEEVRAWLKNECRNNSKKYLITVRQAKKETEKRKN